MRSRKRRVAVDKKGKTRGAPYKFLRSSRALYGKGAKEKQKRTAKGG